MDNKKLSMIGHYFTQWLKHETAYLNSLNEFVSVETALESHDLPMEYIASQPIFYLKDNEAVRTSLMETAILKDKAHNLYLKLIEMADLFIASETAFIAFENNAEYDNTDQSMSNIGAGFIEYLKSKHNYLRSNKNYRELLQLGHVIDAEKARKENNANYEIVIDLHRNLTESTYASLGILKTDADALKKHISKWLATA